MSQPDTDISRQTRRHIFPLIGIALAVLFGVGAMLFWLRGEVATAPAPPVVPAEATAPPPPTPAPPPSPPGGNTPAGAAN